MPNIKPCGHHVIVAPLTWDKETDWGFALTPHENSESAKLEKAGRMYGTLEAVGPQAWSAHTASLLKGRAPAGLIPDSAYQAWASVGDTVMYSRYAGKGVYDPITGAELYLIHDEDILAVFPLRSSWVYNPAEKDKKI